MLLPLVPSVWPISLPEISAHQKGSSQARASPLAESSTKYAYRLSGSLVAREAGLLGYCHSSVVPLLQANESLLC